MKSAFRSHAAQTTVAIVLVGIRATPTAASDYGPMVTGLLISFAAFCTVMIVLGALTAGILAYAFRRKRFWLLTPLFALLWFALVFGSWQIWMNYLSEDARKYRNWKPPRPSTPLPRSYAVPPSELDDR